MNLILARKLINEIKPFFSKEIDFIIFNDGHFLGDASEFKSNQIKCTHFSEPYQFEITTSSAQRTPQDSQSIVFIFNVSADTSITSHKSDFPIHINVNNETPIDIFEIHVTHFTLHNSTQESTSPSLIPGEFPSQTHLIFNLAEKAQASYYRLQTLPQNAQDIGKVEFILNAQAKLNSFVFSKGSHLTKHHLKVQFKGPGATAQFMLANLNQNNQRSDYFSRIEHLVGECSSDQLYKSVLLDQGQSSMIGEIYIAPQAQKANSNQLFQNLLIGDQVVAIAQPVLQIYADDVKATHGATYGQINLDELFYLQSRGISQEKSLNLLNKAFLEESFLKIPNLEARKFCISLFEGVNLRVENLI